MPNVEVTALTFRGEAGELVSETLLPSRRNRFALRFEEHALADLAKCDEALFAVDNLSKSPAGQAVQNNIVMFGFADKATLWQLPVLP